MPSSYFGLQHLSLSDVRKACLCYSELIFQNIYKQMNLWFMNSETKVFLSLQLSHRQSSTCCEVGEADFLTEPSLQLQRLHSTSAHSQPEEGISRHSANQAYVNSAEY